MECNKDEAIRALSIAECRLESKDLAGAKKFALKAQALYPHLHGISQTLTTLNLLVLGAKKISGEVDWYSVLSVNPWADDETIRKQYRKLALVVHPDKNKSVGADGAFKLILEAWSLLSDKAKRLAYNQRRGLPSAPPPPPRTNAGDNFTSRTTSVPKPTAHNSSAKVPTSSTPTPPTNGPSAPPPPRTNGGENFTNRTTSVPKPKTHNSSAKDPTSSTPTPPTNGPSAPPPPRTNGADNSAKTTSVPKPKTHNSGAKVPTSSTPTPPTNGPSAPPPPPRTNGADNSAKTTSLPKPKTHNSGAKAPTSSTPTPPTNGPSAPPPPPRTNGVDNSASKTTSVPKPKTRNSSAKVPTSSKPTPPTKRDGCKQTFKASETTPPININNTDQVPRQPQQAPNLNHIPGPAKKTEPAKEPRPAQKTRPVRNSGPSQKRESAKNPRPTKKPGKASGGVDSVRSPNFQKVQLSEKTDVANNLGSGKSGGADAAFKLISEAWDLLMAYNKEKSSSGFQEEVSSHTADPSAPLPPKTNQVSQQKVPLSDKTNVDSNLDAFTAAKASNVVHDKLKRMHTESKPSDSLLEEHVKRKKIDKDSYGQGENHNMAQGNGVSGHGSRVYDSSGTKQESSNAIRDSGARNQPRY